MVVVTQSLLGILALLAATSRIAATPLAPRQQSAYDFRGCTLDQQSGVDAVLDDMQELAQAAIGPSESSNAGQDWYKAWWGTYDPNTKGMLPNEKINTRYEKLAAFKKRQGRGTTFACESNARCCSAGVFTGGVVACQNRRGDQDIFLCTPFFRWNPERIGSLVKQSGAISLELDKWRSRPSILLHELTHALFKSKDSPFPYPLVLAGPSTMLSTDAIPFTAAFDQVWYPDGAKTVAYGHVHDLQYTLNNTAGARLNADHYEKFATAAYYGRGNVGWFATRPEDVTTGPHY